MLLLALACAPALRATSEDAVVDLPADHAPHPEAQTEWWHVHAELEEPSTGHTLELFAGFVVERTQLDRVAGFPVRLAVNPFHSAYVQLVDEGGARYAQRYNFPDLPTAFFAGPGLDLRHGDWRIHWDQGALRLRVSVGAEVVELELNPGARPTTLPGEGGRIELAGDPHLWMQQEQMETRGRWRRGLSTRWLEGSGFYKHQWGRLYDEELDGFEWISLNLDAERSLAIGWLLDDGVSGAPGSFAWLGTGGSPIPMPLGSVRVEATETWHSRRSGADWPVAWHIEGPGLELDVRALQPEQQEIHVFPAAMYVGPAHATGHFAGQQVDVDAFIEQVGHDMPEGRFLFRSDAPD